MAQVERLADLAFRQDPAVREEVPVDAGDGWLDAPCAAHLAPCIGEGKTDAFGGIRVELQWGMGRAHHAPTLAVRLRG